MIHQITSLNTAFDPLKAGWIAIAIAVTAMISVITIVLLFSGNPVFGPINDITNAVLGLLSAWFVWQLQALLRERLPGTAILFLLAASVGAAAIIVSSLLVAFGRMHWMTGALYMAMGYGLFGAWLLALHRLPGSLTFLTPGIARLGIITASGMLFGLLAVPLLATHVSFARNLLTGMTYLGILAGYLLYPLWCWLAGRVLVSS
jgi:hypothetical protein